MVRGPIPLYKRRNPIEGDIMAGKHSSRKWKKHGKCRWKTRKKKLRERRRKAKIRAR